MRPDAIFERFFVLLSNLWASQCGRCGQVIYRQYENELPQAEAEHDCVTKKESGKATADGSRDEIVKPSGMSSA